MLRELLLAHAYTISDIVIKPSNIGGDESNLVALILSWLSYAVGVLAVGYLVYSGILYISAAGNPDNAKKGLQGIINAVIGIIIATLAFTIIRVVVLAAKGTM